MIEAHRNYNPLRLFMISILAVGLITLIGCITTSPPSTPRSTPTPSVAPQEPGQDYVEGQWILENRTANLSSVAEEGVIHKIRLTFDKPVDVWFDHIDYVILSIGGSSPKYPPHHTYIYDALGKPLYYFMGSVTSFSYTVTTVGNKDVASYILHIRPSKEGDTVTVTQRIYEWYPK